MPVNALWAWAITGHTTRSMKAKTTARAVRCLLIVDYSPMRRKRLRAARRSPLVMLMGEQSNGE
jgi:hypothetical protein